MSVKLLGVDAVEFAVKEFSERNKQLSAWGFEKLGVYSGKNESKELWGQGGIRIILTKGLTARSYATEFVKKHGDGICDVRFEVGDTVKAMASVVKNGAIETQSPKKYKAGTGDITFATIAAMGNVTHTFVSRAGSDVFDHEFYKVKLTQKPKGLGMFAVDHLTCNVEVGRMEYWADYYSRVFGFKVTRFFKITTGRTGLLSKVLENEEGTVKIPINEPTEEKSQIQEYLNVNNGPGVQHLALTTADILQTLPKLREHDLKFLDVPDTYYDEVPNRVKGVKEDMGLVKKNRILVDGDTSGYLLQIFSENAVGPFFFEVIQRVGNKGFGEGNFKALFEAIERDQEKRGVL